MEQTKVSNEAVSQRKTLTAQEVADYIGVHLDTIYTMVKQKQIPHFRVRRRIFFSIETINAWMRQLEEESCQEAI